VTVRANTAEVVAAVKRVALVAERNTSLRMMINDDHITSRPPPATRPRPSRPSRRASSTRPETASP
jgi:hypothetical protein